MNTKLHKKVLVAEGTMRFEFEKPAEFSYKAGQSIDLMISNPPETDAEGNMRAFSLSSSPADSFFAITTRLRDTAFKRVLKNLPEGAPLTFEGPFGDLTLHENVARPAVMLAGGIGITPFYAIAADAAERKLPHSITLFYSNRRPEDAAYFSELTELSAKNQNFTFVPTMTDMGQSKQTWTGEIGYINGAMLARHNALTPMSVYYLAGPAGMVAAMRKILNENGVSNDDIRTEEFTGY